MFARLLALCVLCLVLTFAGNAPAACSSGGSRFAGRPVARLATAPVRLLRGQAVASRRETAGSRPSRPACRRDRAPDRPRAVVQWRILRLMIPISPINPMLFPRSPCPHPPSDLSIFCMTGQPIVAGQQLQPETKAGTDGVGWWKLGSKGVEYSVETFVDVDTVANAVALPASYKAARNAGALAIVYAGVALGNVLVLDVQGNAKAIARGFGGLAGISEATVEAQWRLIAV